MTKRRRRRFQLLLTLLGLLFLGTAGTVFADDCRRDIRRAEDCLRTQGAAQGIATAVGTTVVILVNGTSIAQTIIGQEGGEGDASESEEDEEEEDAPRYQLEISTEDRRTSLVADGEDALWIYARVTCDKPDIDTGPITDSIGFAVQGPSAAWLSLSAPQMVRGAKAVRATAGPPFDGARLSDERVTVLISAVIEGEEVTGPLDLTLREDDLRLEVEVW
jgi:hypothetical protein